MILVPDAFPSPTYLGFIAFNTVSKIVYARLRAVLGQPLYSTVLKLNIPHA
jgi:hypothetical protein